MEVVNVKRKQMLVAGLVTVALLVCAPGALAERAGTGQPEKPPSQRLVELVVICRALEGAAREQARAACVRVEEPTIPPDHSIMPPVEIAPLEPTEPFTSPRIWREEPDFPALFARIWRYCQAMGFQGLDYYDAMYLCKLAYNAGYDPRLWVVVAVAESSGGKDSSNYFGFCGGPGSPWARPSGGWREQGEYFHQRVTEFYSRHVDISDPAQVLWFHHEGEALAGRNPYTVFYARNVMSWLRAI